MSRTFSNCWCRILTVGSSCIVFLCLRTSRLVMRTHKKKIDIESIMCLFVFLFLSYLLLVFLFYGTYYYNTTNKWEQKGNCNKLCTSTKNVFVFKFKHTDLSFFSSFSFFFFFQKWNHVGYIYCLVSKEWNLLCNLWSSFLLNIYYSFL